MSKLYIMPGLTFRLMWPPAALETVQTSGEGLLSRKGKEEKNKGLIQWASSSLPGNQCVTRQWFIGCVCSRWNSWKQKREREGEERARERWVRLSASLSAMFTLAALSPPVPKLRRCPPGINIHSYRHREGARGYCAWRAKCWDYIK